MIKLLYVIERKADVSPKDFYEYWLRSHGPRVKSHAGTLNMKRYVQSHLLDIPDNEVHRSLRGMLPPVAGLTEVWWDSLEAYLAAVSTDAAREASADLLADEETFIDIARSSLFITQEHVIFDYGKERPLGPDATKVAYIVSRRDDMSVEACHKTWLEDHGPLVRNITERLPNRTKYVQSHTIAPEINAAISKKRGMAPAFDGLTEVWVNPNITVPADINAEANKLLIADERRFVEFSRSRRFMTKEYPIFDYT